MRVDNIWFLRPIYYKMENFGIMMSIRASVRYHFSSAVCFRTYLPQNILLIQNFVMPRETYQNAAKNITIPARLHWVCRWKIFVSKDPTQTFIKSSLYYGRDYGNLSRIRFKAMISILVTFVCHMFAARKMNYVERNHNFHLTKLIFWLLFQIISCGWLLCIDRVYFRTGHYDQQRFVKKQIKDGSIIQAT